MKTDKLIKSLNVSLETARLINRVLRAPGDKFEFANWIEERATIFPKTVKWISQCYNPPGRAELQASCFDDLLGGMGVEPIRIEGAHIDRYHFDIVACYVNMGDTYTPTLLHDNRSDKWILCSWGDFVESMEREETEE